MWGRGQEWVRDLGGSQRRHCGGDGRNWWRVRGWTGGRRVDRIGGCAHFEQQGQAGAMSGGVLQGLKQMPSGVCGLLVREQSGQFVMHFRWIGRV